MGPITYCLAVIEAYECEFSSVLVEHVQPSVITITTAVVRQLKLPNAPSLVVDRPVTAVVATISASIIPSTQPLINIGVTSHALVVVKPAIIATDTSVNDVKELLGRESKTQ